MTRFALLLIAGCWSGTSPTPRPQPQPTPGSIVVDIASVSLAEDCGTGAQPAVPVPHASIPAPKSKPSPAQGSRADISFAGEAACEQTTMQLTIKAGRAGAIRIKRVELLGANGTTVGTLTPRTPSRWVDSGYQPWNESVEAGQQLTASYALSAPDWVLPGGRDPSVAYRVRVTIAIDDEERTFDKPATIEGPAMALPPGVVT